MKITNIEWDTEENDVQLPSEVELEQDINEDEIADYLSDTYGYCVFSYSIR